MIDFKEPPEKLGGFFLEFKGNLSIFEPKWFKMMRDNMKSITIHNIDDELYNLIRQSAQKNRRSLNQEVKEKLSMFFTQKVVETQENTFRKYFGIWSVTEREMFDDNVKDLRKVNESDWK